MAVDMDIDYADLRTVEMITVSDNVNTAATNTPTNDATDTITNSYSIYWKYYHIAS